MSLPYGIHNPRVGFARSDGQILRYATRKEAEEAALEWNTAHGQTQAGSWTAHFFTHAQRRALSLSFGKSVSSW